MPVAVVEVRYLLAGGLFGASIICAIVAVAAYRYSVPALERLERPMPAWVRLRSKPGRYELFRWMNVFFFAAVATSMLVNAVVVALDGGPDW